MAGYVIYSFDWDLFEDLTSNPNSSIPAQIAEKLARDDGEEHDGPLSSLPASKDEAASVIGTLFQSSEWFADQSDEDVQLRHEIFMHLLFNEDWESIGLSAELPEQECVAFELPHLVGGAYELDLDRMKGSSDVLFKQSKNAPKQPTVFSLFGNRPFRHGKWEGETEQIMEFEEMFERPAYGVHSKAEVQEMLAICEASLPKYADVRNEDFAEMLSDLHVELKAAVDRGAGIFVDNDY